MRPLLLIDPDPTMTGLLASLLAQHGFAPVAARTAAEGLRLLDDKTAAVLLEVALPDDDGVALVRRLRDRGDRRPLVLLTGKGEDADVIRGLQAGADDYVTKPFNYLVLSARLEAVLRRAGWAATAAPTGDGLDRDQRVLRLGGRLHPLTATEWRLLEAMIARPGRAFTRDELWELVDAAGAGDAYDRAIDLHVARLRAKIEPNPRAPRHLLTVRGVGYRFTF